MAKQFFQDRSFRVCYWDGEKRIVDSRKSSLERQLKYLGDIDLITLDRLEDPNFDPCDLLIITAEHVPEQEFAAWLVSLESRLTFRKMIRVPALIFADLPIELLAEIYLKSAKQNWYFDVISSSDLNSLPIRIANLLRIHDHLHELSRYQNQLAIFEEKIEELEKLILPGHPN